MQWAMTLAESGWLPDPFLRAGIRRLLRSRLSSVASPELRATVIEKMAAGPIALSTDIANFQHYEIPTEFFRIVLGQHLKYSACLWESGSKSLDDAEASALAQICERAGIEDGMRVLDLGCGWGSLSLWIAERFPGCRVTAVSNSRPQAEVIQARSLQRKLDTIDVVTADMNSFEADLRYDRIVSIEMFEHMRNYTDLLNRVSGWLEEDGKLFIHIFCHHRYPYFFEDGGPSDWMARHFFTGGLMPSEDLLDEFAESLELETRWQVNGKHYEKTANTWLQNMDQNRDEILEIFGQTYGEREAERWLQRWRMFFLACAELFGYNRGREWFVSHSLWNRLPASIN